MKFWGGNNILIIITVTNNIRKYSIIYARGMAIDVLLNGFSIAAKEELQSLCCMMGKTVSPRCHLLSANGW